MRIARAAPIRARVGPARSRTPGGRDDRGAHGWSTLLHRFRAALVVASTLALLLLTAPPAADAFQTPPVMGTNPVSFPGGQVQASFSFSSAGAGSSMTTTGSISPLVKASLGPEFNPAAFQSATTGDLQKIDYTTTVAADGTY